MPRASTARRDSRPCWRRIFDARIVACIVLVAAAAVVITRNVGERIRRFREVSRETFRAITTFDATNDRDVWSFWLLPHEDVLLVSHGPLTVNPDNQRIAVQIWARWFFEHVRPRVVRAPTPLRFSVDDGLNCGWDWATHPTKELTLVLNARVGDDLAIPVPDTHMIDIRTKWAAAVRGDPGAFLPHELFDAPLSARVDRAVWRGTIAASKETNFFDSCPGPIDNPAPAIEPDGTVRARGLFVQMARERGWDVDLACDVKDGALACLYEGPRTLLPFRYHVDLDGISNSWSGFLWKGGSGAVVIKHRSTWRMWYSDRFRPGEHYVEFGDTFVDFPDALDWARSHPAESEAMVKAMRAEWLRTFGTWEPAIQVTLDALVRFGWEVARLPAA